MRTDRQTDMRIDRHKNRQTDTSKPLQLDPPPYHSFLLPSWELRMQEMVSSRR